MKSLHLALNLVIIAGVGMLVQSCGTTGSDPNALLVESVLKQLPPIKITKATKGGKEVSVTVYPDGSQPTEVLIDGAPITEPVEIKL